MDRDKFMELVYETFADEPDNVLANGIIEAADTYAEHEKAQLSQEGATKDTISRQAAIDALKEHRALYCDNTPETFSKLSHVEKSRVDELDTAIATLVNLPTIQPEPAIPLSWIEKHIEWLKGLDNEFAKLAAAHISVMVKKWRDEQNERTD